MNYAVQFGDRGVAAVHTVQCHGGVCAPIIDRAEDYVAGSSNANYVAPMKCLFNQLKKDILGESRYCLDLDKSGSREPYDGSNCKKVSHALFPPLSLIRSGQGSIGLRGVSSTNAVYAICGTSYNNQNGLKRYSLTNIGGDPETMVEYAPAVIDAVLNEENAWLHIQTSSAIDPDTVEVTGSAIGTPPEKSSDKVILSFAPDSMGVSIALNPSFSIMTYATWGLSPEELEYRHGQKQSNWSSFIEITFNAKAPNGVPLRGNLGGDLLWPDQVKTTSVSPYMINSGRGGSFKVRIPTIPEYTCCMPHLEFSDDGVRQNGCSCSHVSNPDKCETYSCCWNDSAGVKHCRKNDVSEEFCDSVDGQFQTYRGATTKWANCCSSFLGCDIFVDTALEPRPVCEPGMSAQPYMKREYQYKKRPYDTSLPAKCSPIIFSQQCTTH
jgi:hypothetical protein